MHVFVFEYLIDDQLKLRGDGGVDFSEMLKLVDNDHQLFVRCVFGNIGKYLSKTLKRKLCHQRIVQLRGNDIAKAPKQQRHRLQCHQKIQMRFVADILFEQCGLSNPSSAV